MAQNIQPPNPISYMLRLLILKARSVFKIQCNRTEKWSSIFIIIIYRTELLIGTLDSDI